MNLKTSRFVTKIIGGATLVVVCAVSGCFPAVEIDDVAPDLSERQQKFEIVAPILRELPGADLQTAIAKTTFDDSRVRRAAALRLMTVGYTSPEAVGALIPLLRNDTSPRVRSAAVRALGQLVRGGEGVSAIVEAVCDPHPNVRLYALKSLFHLDATANQAILDFLVPSKASSVHCPTKSDPQYTLRQELAYQLEEQGAKFQQLYIAGLQHPSTEAQRFSLQMLRKIGRPASAALPQIVKLLATAPDNVKYDCIQALIAIGDQHPLVMPAISKARFEASARIQNAAQNAISQIQAQYAAKGPQATGSRPTRAPQPR